MEKDENENLQHEEEKIHEINNKSLLYDTAESQETQNEYVFYDFN